jgi:hypothetical protein
MGRIKNRFPGSSVVGGFPDSAIVHTHKKNIWLRGNAYCTHRAPGPKRADASVLKFLIERWVNGLTNGGKGSHHKENN